MTLKIGSRHHNAILAQLYKVSNLGSANVWCPPFTLDNILHVSSNSTEFSEVVENAVSFRFYANHSIDDPMNAYWLENAKCYFFEISPKNITFIFSLILKDQKHEMSEEHIFDLSKII